MDESWDEAGDEALWWQLYLASDDHQRMAAQLLLAGMVLLFLLLLPVHLCNSLFQERASERESAMIIFNTSDRLQNKSGNIIEHLNSHLEKIDAKYENFLVILGNY